MDGIMLKSSQNHNISPNKSHIGKSMKIKNHSFHSRPSENLYFQPNFQAGILQTPHPFLYHSYPPYWLPQNPPAVFPLKNGSFPKKSNSKINDPYPSQVPLKSKISFNSNSPNKKGSTMMKTNKKVARILSPDPKNNLSKDDVPKMMVKSTIDKQVDKISSSVIFTISPPPSSLPLPTFSLRPKLSCKAQAANIDAGATDDLRRLLRLP